MFLNHFSGNRQGAIAPALDSQVDDHRTVLHRAHGVLTDKNRCWAAGYERCRDDDVGLGAAFGSQHRLTVHPAFWHGPGVAAYALGNFTFFVAFERYVDELSTQLLNLFLG